MQLTDLKAIIEPILSEMGIDLIDLEIHGRQGSRVIRIFADEAGGISLARCTSASRAVAAWLDQQDLIPGHYTLELSSPGTDRPLTTEKDFIRHQGRKVSVTFHHDAAQRSVAGIILNAAAGILHLQAGEEELAIPLADLILAKIIVEFK